MTWLDQTITSLAQRTGVDAEALRLSAGERREILDVARIASHASGERINAPLLCYVLGALASRGVALGDAAAVVREMNPEP